MTTRLAWRRIFRNWRPSRSPAFSTTASTKTACPSPWLVLAFAIRCAWRAAPMRPGATLCSPITLFSPPRSICSRAGSTIFAGGQPLAKIVEPAREQIERGGENSVIGEHNVAPGRIGAARQAQRIAKARTSQGDGQAVFVEAVVEKAGERDGRQLRKMRRQANRVVMLRCT